MSAARLVVVGDTLLDSDVTGSVTRLCPDAPAPIVDLGEQVQRPGGAGLAALLAARAGQEVTLVTALGEDPPGRLLAELLAAEVDLVPLPLRGSTVRKTRVRAAGQSLLRIDSGDGRAVDGPVGAGVRAALLGAGAVLVADYGR
ncbi:MAG TPA: D-beta-D-heptose 1-phosphate adenosyltransferase, partial [Actinomycetota bacterium]